MNKPEKRWGHSSVAAYNRMFIIGGYNNKYLGDIWIFDFLEQEFHCAQLLQNLGPISSPDDQYTSVYRQLKQDEICDIDKNYLSRSNHTSVFYEEQNSIYVFGGAARNALGRQR